MCTCSICLNIVRTTRQNTPLRCGHVFHASCLDEWKSKGKNTCPMCRKVFDVSHYRVLVRIEDNFNDTAHSRELSPSSIFRLMDTLDLTFDMENSLDVERLLVDLGLSLSDFDPPVFHTE